MPPYYNSVQVRSALLRIIERELEERGNKPLEGMYAFYRNPAPRGQKYLSDEQYVNSKEFEKKYSRIEELLLKKIPHARTESTTSRYTTEALELSLELWKKTNYVEIDPAGNYHALSSPPSSSQ